MNSNMNDVFGKNLQMRLETMMNGNLFLVKMKIINSNVGILSGHLNFQLMIHTSHMVLHVAKINF